MILKCPLDGALLKESHELGLPHWTCESCEGRLVFLKTLRYSLLVTGTPDVEAQLRAGKDSDERSCPHCRRPLKIFQLAGWKDHEYELQACAPCEWVWFASDQEFAARGAERERINQQYESYDEAFRRFRFWHTFQDWGRGGLLIPWFIWMTIVALMIRNHIGAREALLKSDQFTHVPMMNSAILLFALFLTIVARSRMVFGAAIILVLWTMMT